MSIYIKGMGNISPQQSWNDQGLLLQAFDYRGVLMKAVEPDYDLWIDPRQSRRMSRLMKMGITAALMALQEAEIEAPDGMITGTGLGCIGETENFLTQLIQQPEENLVSTSFVQSAHHAIASTLGMMLQCSGYNQTYSHGAFSFESSLLDALMHADEVPDDVLLVGGLDEITEASHTVLSRFGIYRRKLASTLHMFSQPRKGTVHGEGATFFVVSGIRDATCMASVESVRTFYRPKAIGVHNGIETFIREAGLAPGDIDLVLLGKSGNKNSDLELDKIVKPMFQRSNIGLFKHLCGEYPTASAFATWLAARIIFGRHIPESVVFRQVPRQIRNVLVINSSFGTHYTLILVKECRDIIV